MSLTPNAVDLAVARVREGDPDRATRPGTATRTFIIDPWAMMNQPLVSEALLLRERLYVGKIAKMSEEDADGLAANFAIERRPGAYSRGTMRLYFGEPVSAQITTSTTFQTVSGEVFLSTGLSEISSAQMRLNFDGTRYYWDVAVQAAQVGENGNVPAGAISLIKNGPAGTAFVTNPERFTGGLSRETNAQLGERIKKAVALRAFVTKPGIETVIGTAFPALTHIVPIGKLDEEMVRDLVTGTDLVVDGEALGGATPFHAGGKVDLYVRSQNYVSRVATLIFASGSVRPTLVFGRAATGDDEQGVTFEAPLLDIMMVQLGDPVTGICTGEELVENVDYEVICETPGKAFSTQAVWRLRLLTTSSFYSAIIDDPGKSLVITYLTNPDVAEVQAYCDDPSRRNLCEDLLVKAMVPVEVDVDVTYCPKPSSELGDGEPYASTERVQGLIETFLWNVKQTSGFDVDELYRMLYSLPVRRVNKPIGVRIRHRTASGTLVEIPSAETALQILRVSVDAVQASVRIALIGANVKDLGVSLGDTMTLSWIAASETPQQVIREVIGVERRVPTDADLPVVVVDEPLPARSEPTRIDITRRTVSNIAGIPRVSTLIPRTVRALAVAV